MKDFQAYQDARSSPSPSQQPATQDGVEELRRLNAELRHQMEELRETNQSLSDSEQRLRLAIATGQIGLWVWNSTNVTNAGDWSPRLKEIFGLPPDTEVTHEIFLGCVHPEDRERVNADVMGSLGGVAGGEYRCDYRIFRRDDSSERWVTARGQAFFDAQGTPVRFIGTLMDVTERKLNDQSIARQQAELERRVTERTEDLARSNETLQLEIVERRRAEDKLRHSEAYLAEAQRLSRTGSFGWNVATAELVWSDETYCILGYDRTVQPTLDLALQRIHPEDIAFVRQALSDATRDRSNLDLEHRFLMPDGAVKYVHVLAQPAKTETAALQFVGAIMDVTDRKHAEEALRRSEAFLAEAQKLSGTGSFCLNVARRELICSAEAVHIGGWEPGTKPTLEQSLERVHPDDRLRVQGILEKALEEGSLLEYEHRLLLPDGTVRHVHTVANPTRNASGETEFVGAVIDITEKKKTEDALRASEQLARGQWDALTQMLEMLAGESDPDQLPRHVVSTIRTQLGAVSVTIWERNEDRLDLLGVTEEGQFLTRGEASYFEGSIPITGPAPPLWVEALQTGSHILIEDIDKEPTRIALGDGRTAVWRQCDLTSPFANLKLHLLAQGVCALLICPLFLAKELAGIIGIRFKGSRIFGTDEIELTKALAHQATLSIQLMRLSQQSRRAAVVAERNRMARDIHDTLAQGLTGIIVQLEAAEDAQSRGLATESGAHLGRASELARESLQEARRSVRALRPQVLEQKDLPVALELLFQKMTAGASLQAALTVHGVPRRLDCDVAQNLLHIVQETLTNALRHASARHFTARLTYDVDQVRVELQDNGAGFDPASPHEGLGLLGMQERVEAMGGHIQIESILGTGTMISIVIPVRDRVPLKTAS